MLRNAVIIFVSTSIVVSLIFSLYYFTDNDNSTRIKQLERKVELLEHHDKLDALLSDMMIDFYDYTIVRLNNCERKVCTIEAVLLNDIDLDLMPPKMKKWFNEEYFYIEDSLCGKVKSDACKTPYNGIIGEETVIFKATK
ncbi:MAG: hypothetical protein GF317_04675 [Candidatus Lokiarchaeota archaeon]|nr:hypothetical protein [Candidatus Lokiarchaeota archaeon]